MLRRAGRQMNLNGQMLLVTILVLTIAITIALSLIGRATSDIGMSARLEESARAFSAAEAGIEDALQNQTQTITPVSVSKDAAYTTTIAQVGGTSSVYSFASSTKKGDVATVWLVSHAAGGALDEDPNASHYCSLVGACTIDVCWNQSAVIPATEAVVYYLNTGTGVYDLQRFAFEPDPVRTGNKFTPITDTAGCGKDTGVYKTTVTLPTSNALPLMLRLRPYYQDAVYSVSPVGGRILPVQYQEVTSVGKTGTGVTRKIIVKKQYESPPSVFDYVLYSGGDIKNASYGSD